jgi:hypothetical protein
MAKKHKKLEAKDIFVIIQSIFLQIQAELELVDSGETDKTHLSTSGQHVLKIVF